MLFNPIKHKIIIDVNFIVATSWTEKLLNTRKKNETAFMHFKSEVSVQKILK